MTRFQTAAECAYHKGVQLIELFERIRRYRL